MALGGSIFIQGTIDPNNHAVLSNGLKLHEPLNGTELILSQFDGNFQIKGFSSSRLFATYSSPEIKPFLCEDEPFGKPRLKYSSL